MYCHYRIDLQWAIVTILAPSFLNGMSLIFGHTRSPATELATIERLKYTCIICDHSSAFCFRLIYIILVGHQEIHKSMDEFEFGHIPSLFRVSCPWASINIPSPGFFCNVYLDFLILADNQTVHSILSVWVYSYHYFKFRVTVNYGVFKECAGSPVNDRCPLGYLFFF